MNNKNTALVIALAFLPLWGCVQNEEVVQIPSSTPKASTSQRIRFAENLTPFVFQNEAFDAGEKFQLIEAGEGFRGDGQYGVWTSSTVATGILFINVPIRLGLALNKDLCSFGNTIRSDSVSVGVMSVRDFSISRAPENVCFRELP